MAILASDDFNRANNNDLGANWSPVHNSLQIASNEVADVLQLSVDCAERYSAVIWPNDHWSEATIGTTGTNGLGAGMGVCVRAAAAAATYYRLVASSVGWELSSFIAGAFQGAIANSATPAFANGDRIYLEIRGTTLVVKRNTTNGIGGTVLTTQTSATIASGSPGVNYSANDFAATINSWMAGDFSTGRLLTRSFRPNAFTPGHAR